MGLFEKVAVTDLKLRLALIPVTFVCTVSVLIGATIFQEEWAVWGSAVVGAALGMVITVAVYRRLSNNLS
jgi:hypothetical protein